MPDMPAMMVNTILSERIWFIMSLGLAPMARRMPISVVRSLTVTIIILLTPMAPANNVPNPTIQLKILMPLNRLSIMLNIASAFTVTKACLSSGWIRCACFITLSTFFSISEMEYPGLAV